MTWRSPFQTTKGGGVPFPALTPWANSPGQLSDTGSPMQTSPTPVLKSVIKQGMPPASMKTSSLGKASPMDAAPYTPLSAPRGVHSTAPESDSSGTFVGKLSFTPHISQHRQRFPNSARKRSPRLSPDEQTTNSAGSLTQPPQSSIYFAQSGTTSTSCSAAADQVGLDLQTATSSSSAQTAPSYTELRRHSSRFAPSTAQRPLPTAPSTTQASDSADSTHARFAPQPSASCETGPSLRDVPHITFNGRDTLSTVQAGKDAADASDQSPQAALTLPKPGSVSDQTASATTLQLSFGASQTVLSPLHDNSLPSAAVQKQDAASAQALQRLSLKGSGLSAARARSSVGRWEPMQASVDSPEKQELGRRIFGGLPVSSPKSTKKTPASAAKRPGPQASAHLADTAGLDRLAAFEVGSSDAVAAAAAADPLSGAGHASVIEQLQLQAVQAATSGGVLLEQIASSNDEPESGAPVQLKGPEQMRAALAQLRQLQQAGSQHAEKLQVRIDEHAGLNATYDKRKAKATAAALAWTPAPHAATARENRDWPKQIAFSLPHDVTQMGQNVTSMLKTLQLLQQQGTEFANRIKL